MATWLPWRLRITIWDYALLAEISSLAAERCDEAVSDTVEKIYQQIYDGVHGARAHLSMKMSKLLVYRLVLGINKPFIEPEWRESRNSWGTVDLTEFNVIALTRNNREHQHCGLTFDGLILLVEQLSINCLVLRNLHNICKDWVYVRFLQVENWRRYWSKRKKMITAKVSGSRFSRLKMPSRSNQYSSAEIGPT